MKTGMTSLTFRNHSIEDVIRIAKEAGIDGIEWGAKEQHAVSEENIEKIKRLSKEAGIEIFSLGSYCYMLDLEDCIRTVDMAVKLSAPVIRVWAGQKSPQDCSEEEFNLIVSNTKVMAEYAEKYGIMLGFEFHRNSLTETAEGAVRLIKAVDRDNVKTYWQIDERLDFEQNIRNLKVVTPCLAGVFHVQNSSVEEGRLLLEGIKEKLKVYLAPFLQTDYKVLIEFVKGGLEESFYKDAEVLKRILED